MTQFTSRVAYIGLGNMGSGMATNIAIKGNLEKPLLLFNRSPARAEKLVNDLPQGKAKVAASISDAIDASDIIFMSLGDDNAVFGTVGTALKNDVKDKIFIDCSTIARQSTDKVAEQVNAAGAGFIACPVFGSPLQCQQGNIVCCPAGPAQLVERILPLCEGVMGRATIPLLDKEPSTASALKCIGNSILFDAVQAVAEGHVLAQKSGVGSDALQKFIQLFFAPCVPYSERMLNGVYYQSEHPPFSVDHARKDIRFALDLAKDYDVPMRALQVADDYYAACQEHMDGEKADISALFGAVRKASGLPFEA
ncbi:hypothetical protein AMS68_004241 [Peltaster fructicola]|uniref:6-phosphogluconate dehydrogenase NADP-binding domain-containing protein n=1 Tax=Peltaster fructicola TaxID=286661 RepID=A0A6H0XVG9_9PEZI|nr:hypothetical protein AMS68_004241 [Peltaster fructicola]